MKWRLVALFITCTASAALARDFSPKECPVIGNTKRHIFHVKGCPNYEQMLVKNKYNDNRKCFKTRDAAKASGYRIAKNCRKEVYQ